MSIFHSSNVTSPIKSPKLIFYITSAPQLFNKQTVAIICLSRHNPNLYSVIFHKIFIEKVYACGLSHTKRFRKGKRKNPPKPVFPNRITMFIIFRWVRGFVPSDPQTSSERGQQQFLPHLSFILFFSKWFFPLFIRYLYFSSSYRGLWH